MKNTMPFYLVQSATIISLFALTACSTAPISHKKSPTTQPTVQQESSGNAVEIAKSITPPPLKPEDLVTLSDIELELQINQAHQQGHLPNFILLNHQLWQNASNSEQAQIEQRIWNRLSQQPLEEIKRTIQRLKQDRSPSVRQWGELLSVLKGPAETLSTQLNHLMKSNSDAIYMHHLLPGIQMQMANVSPPPQHIAVLLPFDGKYEHISSQIKSGIMKAYMASSQTIQLRFYNTSNLDKLEETYLQAKREGADFIIGPLRKEAIDHLITIADENVLALNKIDYAPFLQFSYKSANEVAQLVAHLKAKNYQNIGILSNNSRQDLKMAQTIKQAWNQFPGHSTLLSTYPNKSPKLRKALGDLINEANSKERYNTLRWATGQKLHFFPRTRQDFDAIIIIDDSARMAVFKPQFAFFNLKTPIYGTSQLSPKKPQRIQRNRDLSGVTFLAHPVIFQPENLTSNFEAFGWDSFQVATQLDNLRLGGYLAQGKTGELTLNDQLIQQNLVWAIYNKKGQITPLKMEFLPPIHLSKQP